MRVLLRRLIWITGVAALVGLVVYGFMPQPVSVDLVAAALGPLRVTVDQEGKTRVRDRYTIASPVGGQLTRIVWKPGDKVVKGSTVLASIYPRETEFLDPSARAQAHAKVKAFQSMREKAESTLRQVKVKYEHAQRDRDRLLRLLMQRGAAEQEYDAALQVERAAAEEMRGAQQAIHAAEYELEQARAVLQRTIAAREGEPIERFDVLAPESGHILKVEQESAGVITAGTKLLELGDVSKLEVVIDVLSADAVKVRPDSRVILEHWGGEEPLEARVRVVEPGGYTKISALGVEEQRVNVIADIVDQRESRRTLGDGYRVEARIVIWEKLETLKVPAGAMVRQGSQWAVFVIENGLARLRPVTVGKSNGLETEIVAGLRVGELVIVHAGDRVKDGVAVVPR